MRAPRSNQRYACSLDLPPVQDAEIVHTPVAVPDSMPPRSMAVIDDPSAAYEIGLSSQTSVVRMNHQRTTRRNQRRPTRRVHQPVRFAPGALGGVGPAARRRPPDAAPR